MIKTIFVDLSDNFYDKHATYCLSSYLKAKGIDTNYIRGKKFPQIINRLQSLKPDLLLYSAFTSDVPNFIEFDKLAKKHLKVKTIIGGPGPTYDWSINTRCTIDAFCIGEGEYALADYILSGFKSGNNIILQGETKPQGFSPFVDLDKLPFPERDLVYREDPVVKSLSARQFISGRGCPFNCTYCFNHAFNKMFKDCGKIVRKKSVDYLISEIKQVNERYPFSNVVFQDDTFILDKKWLFEFCDRFPREVGLTYTCNVRANLVNQEIVEALKGSGCVGVNWSIETGNDFLRNTVLKRNMSKENILETGRLLNKYKIPHRIGNVIGLPGETYEQMLETLQLNIEAKADLSLANIFVPYPSLELTDYAIKNNYLSRESLCNLPKNFFTRSALNITPADQLRIKKLLYLFPILSKYPRLFYNKRLFGFVTKLPVISLRIVYEIFYIYMFKRLYKVKTSLRSYFYMGMRYIRG